MELHELIEGHEYIVRYDALRDRRRAPRYVEARFRFERHLGLARDCRPGRVGDVEVAVFRGPRGRKVVLYAYDVARIDAA